MVMLGLALGAQAQEGVVYRDAAEFPVYGKAYEEDGGPRYRRLKKAGEKKIYYVASEGMVRQEDFVDGIHFTDAGMLHYADHLTPILKKVLR